MINKTRRQVLKTIGVGSSIPIMASLGLTSASAFSANSLVSHWAAGGTNMLSDIFPDDSMFNSNKACSLELTEPRILGPCYFSVESRSDISTGLSGLPMQISIKLINRNCEPLANHEIEIWHTNANGDYSADTSNSDDSRRFRPWQCAGSDKKSKQSTWFRGAQQTNEAGRVDFKSCFPGWYSGRATHIHARVKFQNKVSLTTQFCFDETLTNEISTTHVNYIDRGLPDMPLARDRFFRNNREDAFFTTKKNSDGTLLAIKTIMID